MTNDAANEQRPAASSGSVESPPRTSPPPRRDQSPVDEKNSASGSEVPTVVETPPNESDTRRTSTDRTTTTTLSASPSASPPHHARNSRSPLRTKSPLRSGRVSRSPTGRPPNKSSMSRSVSLARALFERVQPAAATGPSATRQRSFSIAGEEVRAGECLYVEQPSGGRVLMAASVEAILDLCAGVKRLDHGFKTVPFSIHPVKAPPRVASADGKTEKSDESKSSHELNVTSSPLKRHRSRRLSTNPTQTPPTAAPGEVSLPLTVVYTHRYLMTSGEFVEKLVSRIKTRFHDGDGAADKYWEILVSLLDEHLYFFTKPEVQSATLTLVGSLSALSISMKKKVDLTVGLFKKNLALKPRAPLTLSPSKNNKSGPIESWQDISPAQCVTQITVEWFDIFASIAPIEFLKNNYRDASTAPNIFRMIGQANKLARVIAFLIVKSPTLRDRARTLEYFVTVAQLFLEQRNFAGVMAVVAGLTQGPVMRLKHTWRELSSKVKATFDELEKLLDKQVYRGLFHEAEPPKIPFLGATLNDLTLISENPSKLDGLVNVAKLRLFATQIDAMRRLQRFKYPLLSDGVTAAYFFGVEEPNEQDMYKLSKLVEPRGNRVAASDDRSKKPKSMNRPTSPPRAARKFGTPEPGLTRDEGQSTVDTRARSGSRTMEDLEMVTVNGSTRVARTRERSDSFWRRSLRTLSPTRFRSTAELARQESTDLGSSFRVSPSSSSSKRRRSRTTGTKVGDKSRTSSKRNSLRSSSDDTTGNVVVPLKLTSMANSSVVRADLAAQDEGSLGVIHSHLQMSGVVYVKEKKTKLLNMHVQNGCMALSLQADDVGASFDPQPIPPNATVELGGPIKSGFPFTILNMAHGKKGKIRPLHLAAQTAEERDAWVFTLLVNISFVRTAEELYRAAIDSFRSPDPLRSPRPR